MQLEISTTSKILLFYKQFIQKFTYDGFIMYEIYTPQEFEDNFSYLYRNLWKGDVIQHVRGTDRDTRHSMVINGYANGKLQVAQHTYDEFLKEKVMNGEIDEEEFSDIDNKIKEKGINQNRIKEESNISEEALFDGDEYEYLSEKIENFIINFEEELEYYPDEMLIDIRKEQIRELNDLLIKCNEKSENYNSLKNKLYNIIDKVNSVKPSKIKTKYEI